MRAKMIVESVDVLEDKSEVLTMRAIHKDDGYDETGRDENNTFALFTPNGRLELTINNPGLLGKYQPGDCYYLDFTKAE